jgi:hypothetical protein
VRDATESVALYSGSAAQSPAVNTACVCVTTDVSRQS